MTPVDDYLLPEWRAVLEAMPTGTPMHPSDVFKLCVWRRSYSQLCHAMRKMASRGLLLRHREGTVVYFVRDGDSIKKDWR